MVTTTTSDGDMSDAPTEPTAREPFAPKEHSVPAICKPSISHRLSHFGLVCSSVYGCKRSL